MFSPESNLCLILHIFNIYILEHNLLASYFVENLSSLNEAVVGVGYALKKGIEYANWILELLRRVTSVKSLLLNRDTMAVSLLYLPYAKYTSLNSLTLLLADLYSTTPWLTINLSFMPFKHLGFANDTHLS
ncbi:unnamed protein product [Ilex paraguariensis]|uniref:Uncharacterized protein n=1 Tax=Ilex paraguariensis TaxID=185542 RepID=A0ABC8T7W1_9AQUA